MQENPQSKINKIKKLKADICYAETAIQQVKNKQRQVTENFDKQIQAFEEEIDLAQSDIDEIKQSIIKADLIDIIEGVAKQWKVKPGDIMVSCTSTETLVNSLSNHFTRTQIKPQNTFLQIQLSLPPKKKNTSPKTFTCIFEGNEPQKDGKDFKSHIISKFYRIVDGEHCVVSVFDDYRQLIAQFKLDSLILETPSFNEIVSSTSMAEIILNAAEQYVEKHPAQQKYSYERVAE